METTELERLRAAVLYLTGDVITGGYLPHHVLCAVQDKVDAILNPPPTYEEVTVERWECPDCGSVYMVNNNRTEDDPCAKSEPWGDCTCSGGRLKEDKAIKLTGTRRVPVKQPVRKRVSGTIDSNPEGIKVDDEIVLPPHGTPVTIEWEE